MRHAAVALLLLLAACHPPRTLWHPTSVHVRTSQLTEAAVEIGNDDVETMEDLGSQTGVMEIPRRNADYAPTGAAWYGGTHFLASDTDEKFIKYRVFRVPKSEWHRLPRTLQPH